jgi:hypothetical protein
MPASPEEMEPQMTKILPGMTMVPAVVLAVALSLTAVSAPSFARTPQGWTGNASRTVGPNGGWNFNGQRSINGNSANSSVSGTGPNGRAYTNNRSSSYGDGTGTYNHSVTNGQGQSANSNTTVTKNGNNSVTVNQDRTGFGGASKSTSNTYSMPNQ